MFLTVFLAVLAALFTWKIFEDLDLGDGLSKIFDIISGILIILIIVGFIWLISHRGDLTNKIYTEVI